MDKKLYWISNPLGMSPFNFTNKREANKALKYLNEKYPDEGLCIYEEDIWTFEEIKYQIK